MAMFNSKVLNYQRVNWKSICISFVERFQVIPLHTWHTLLFICFFFRVFTETGVKGSPIWVAHSALISLFHWFVDVNLQHESTCPLLFTIKYMIYSIKANMDWFGVQICLFPCHFGKIRAPSVSNPLVGWTGLFPSTSCLWQNDCCVNKKKFYSRID